MRNGKGALGIVVYFRWWHWIRNRWSRDL